MKQFMDENFLLSTETAQKLYRDYAAAVPVLDYHCHINPQEIYEDRKFENITQVWLGGDHYKWRFMRSCGVDEFYITGGASDKEKFLKWAECLGKAIGNPLYHWSHLELRKYFDYKGILNKNTAEEVWELCNKKLAEPSMTVRNIIKQSNVTLICTTDDPVDSLEWHKKIAADDSFDVQVLPAWRPDKAMNIEKPDYFDYLAKLADASGDALSNYIIDILYKLPSKGWDALMDGKFFDGIQSAVEKTHDALLHFNYFLGLNISDTPWYIIKSNFTDKPDKWLLFVILALLIPVLSYLTQMINIKLMPQTTNGNDQVASQMKMMNLMMPLMSLFFCFTVPVGLGIYWICSALVRGIQQFFVNRHIENLDLEAVMAKNEEKAKKKREKMGLSEDYIKKAAQMKTKSIENKANVSASADTEEKLAKAAEYKANAKAGSLASKANMVKEFNERNSRK